jgi:regulator of sirC expression with transglutaminase-like and TPR domain
MNNPFFDSSRTSESLHHLLEKHPCGDIPLDISALVIARSFCGHVDISTTLGRLDQLAEETARIAGPSPSEDDLIRALRDNLFVYHGFSGNKSDYYSPENSFLHRVIETRKGIPISLSLVMMEVGRRLNLPLVGIGLPCHFMVGLLTGCGTRYFDPFHGGIERSREECVELAQVLSGGSVEVTHCHFLPLPKTLFLTRMLCNLRSIYRQRTDHRNLIITLRHLLLLNPGDPNIHLELALSLVEQGEVSQAYKHYCVCSEITAGSDLQLPLEAAAKRLKQVFAIMN